MIVNQWVPAAHAGDAIGDSARRMRDLFRQLGHTSEIYALTIDSALRNEIRPFDDPRSSTGELTLFHYALPSPMTDAFARLRRRPRISSADAQRQAREAIRVCRLVGPDSTEELHAATTLAVALGWGNDPDSGIALLRDVCDQAKRLGDRDGYFRADANLTTVLDLLGRREDAIEVAYEGIAEARRVGQEAVYGNFLRGNAADSLFLLGRWEEMRTLSTAALEWSEGDVSRVVSLVNLATVEIESNAGELAGSLLGQALLDVETVREAQYSVPAYQAAASFALWRGDLPDARRAAERGWDRVRETEDWSLASKMAATVLEVDAASAIDARDRRDLVTIAAARSNAGEVLVSAAPGWEFADLGGRHHAGGGSHGSLAATDSRFCRCPSLRDIVGA